MEDPVERLRNEQKKAFSGRPPKDDPHAHALGFSIKGRGGEGQGNVLAVPTSKDVHPADLKDNPLYEILQSRLTRKDPVDIDNLVN